MAYKYCAFHHSRGMSLVFFPATLILSFTVRPYSLHPCIVLHYSCLYGTGRASPSRGVESDNSAGYLYFALNLSGDGDGRLRCLYAVV